MDIFTLGYKLDTSDLKRAQRQLNEYSRSNSKAVTSTNQLTSSFSKLGGVAAAAAAAFVSYNTALSAVNTIKGYDSALKGLQATLGATAEETTKLSEQSRQLGATTIYSAEQVAHAQRFLGQAGFGTNEILASTAQVLQLATAGNLDLAAAADLASNVLGGMRLEVDQFNRVNDVLAKTASSSNTNIQQLGQALSYAAPLAASAGMSIEETSAAIGALSDAGLQGSRAGTGLLGVIRQLSNLTPQATTALAKYGVEANDVNIAQRGLYDVMQLLEKANLDAADAFAIFGSEVAPAALILADAATKVGELTTKLENADGAAKQMADTMGSSLDARFKGLKSAVDEIILVIGDKGAQDTLINGLDAATVFARRLGFALDSVDKEAQGTESSLSQLGGVVADALVIGIYTAGQTVDALASQIKGLGESAIAVGRLDWAGAWDSLSKASIESANDFKQVVQFAEAYVNPEITKGIDERNLALAEHNKLVESQIGLVLQYGEIGLDPAGGAGETKDGKPTTKTPLDIGGEATNRIGKNIDDLDRLMAEAINSFSVLEQRNEVLQELSKTQVDLDKQTKEFYEESDDFARGAIESTEDLNKSYEELINRIDESFVTVWDNVLSGSQGALDGLGDMFRRTLAEMAHDAITKPIVVNILGQVGITGGGSQGNIFSGQGDIFGIGDLLGGASSNFSLLNTLGLSTDLQGIAGLGVGSILNYGMASAAGAGSAQAAMLAAQTGEFGLAGAGMTAGAMGTTTGSILSAVSTAVPYISAAFALDSLLGGSISTGLFGTGWRPQDQGLQLTASARQGATAQDYAKSSRDPGWFRKVQYRTRYSDNPELTTALDETVKALSSSIRNAAHDLGFNFAENFSQSMTISLRGKSQEESQQAISDWLTQWSDDLIVASGRIVNYIGRFSREGESHAQTLDRMITQYELLREPMEMVVSELGDMSRHSVWVAEELINLAGSIDVVLDRHAVYYNEFFTQAEKMADLYDDINGSMAAVNLTLPETREEYRKLIETSQLDNKSGRERYNTLMALAGASDKYYDYLEQKAKDVGNSMVTIGDGIDRVMTGIVDKLNSSYDTILGTVTQNTQQSYMEAQQALSESLTKAKAGQSVDVSQIERALSVVSRYDYSGYTSATDIQRDKLITAGIIDELAKVLGGGFIETANTLGTVAGATNGTVDVLSKSVDEMMENLEEHNRTVADIVDKWDRYGMPEVRQ